MKKMVKDSGTVAMVGNQEIGYAAQQAWLINATVQDNILFGRPFNLER